MNNCRWVKSPARPGVNAVYCEKPVKFKLVKDDDGRNVRKYNTWCDEHSQKAKEQEDTSPDDWAL
jgi:hypothetical protein